MIDPQGYRQNVGIILSSQEGKLFWARRIGQDAWQFPQGGIAAHESPEQALFRELTEEVGLLPAHVKILGCTKGWLRYQLPANLIRRSSRPLCIGQKQVWYLLRLLGREEDVRLDTTQSPEFDFWRWVDYWHPLDEVVSFKRKVYEAALRHFEPLLFPRSERGPKHRRSRSNGSDSSG